MFVERAWTNRLYMYTFTSPSQDVLHAHEGISFFMLIHGTDWSWHTLSDTFKSVQCMFTTRTIAYRTLRLTEAWISVAYRSDDYLWFQVMISFQRNGSACGRRSPRRKSVQAGASSNRTRFVVASLDPRADERGGPECPKWRETPFRSPPLPASPEPTSASHVLDTCTLVTARGGGFSLPRARAGRPPLTESSRFAGVCQVSLGSTDSFLTSTVGDVYSARRSATASVSTSASAPHSVFDWWSAEIVWHAHLVAQHNSRTTQWRQHAKPETRARTANTQGPCRVRNTGCLAFTLPSLSVYSNVTSRSKEND